MIYVDENEPIGELQSEFEHRQVLIKRNRDVRTEYEMLHEIGRGKFGRVMKCRDLECRDKYYAAKFVHTSRREDRRNVEREVEIMNSLNHPKLLQLFDAYDNGRNEMCIMTEYIGGGELFDRVIEDEFVLTEKACIAFMKQILQGVEFIHSQQIVHLDLKPENILCHTKTGNRIKIIDFGLARRYEPMKKLQVLFGTPEFVAPEVVNFEPIGYATDMWSIGVITYVLLSGLSPFMGDTDLETMANVTIAEYDYEDEVFDNVSDKAKDFIDKLLMKEKGKRYSCKSCLQHPWLNNTNDSKEQLRNAKENISSFQKDPSKKSNYYIFDHSNHTITPTDESLVLAADVNRKRSLLENCKENEIKRCKTPTRDDIQPKKETSSCSLELWQATERTLTPCWEDIKPLAALDEDAKTDMSWEHDSAAEHVSEPSRSLEENKENKLPIHSETLSNANEIEDPKLISSCSSTATTTTASSEPKISSLSLNVVPSSPLSNGCSMSYSSPSSMSSSSSREAPSSCSSSPSYDSNNALLDFLPPHQSKRVVAEDSPENIFSDIKDIIRNCPEPKSRRSAPTTETEPSPKDRLSDEGMSRARLESPSESFDSSIVELSNKVENTMSTGIHLPRRGRSRQESTSSSISLVKSRFENPRSPVVGIKSPFTSILNRHNDEEVMQPSSSSRVILTNSNNRSSSGCGGSSRERDPETPSLRRRSPSPVVTGAVNRAKGRFESKTLETRNNSSFSSPKSTAYKSTSSRYPSSTLHAPASASSPSSRYYNRNHIPSLSPSILSTTLSTKFSNSRTASSSTTTQSRESHLLRGPFGFYS